MNGQRLDTIYYDLELRTKQFDIDIGAMQQRVAALSSSIPSSIPIRADASQAQRELVQLASSATIATSALLGVGAASLKMADGLKAYEQRLRLVTDSTGELALVQERLSVIADDTFQAYTATIELYARMARSTQELNITQEELFENTEAVSLAVRLSGVSAQSAENALVQFGQALASKELRGDELRSVLEQLPRLAEAIATGMGVTVGQLRSMAAEGQLTAEKVLGAVRGQLGALQEEAAKLEPTLGQALTVFTNRMAQYLAGADDATDATTELARIIRSAADNMEAIGIIAATAGGIFVGRGLGPMIQKGGELLALQGKQFLESQRAAAARVQETEAAMAATAAEVRATQARLADLQATKAAIIAERELTLARLQTANARVATATAAMANPAGSGMTTREAMAAQTAAVQNQSRAVSDLARLGQAQAAIMKQEAAAAGALTVATGAATAAQTAHGAAIARTTLLARTGALAMTGLRGAMAFLGGPIGAAITAAILGISIALSRKAKATEEAREAAARYQEQLEKMTEAQIRARLGELEGERISVMLSRMRPENANPTAQNAISIREAEIGEEVGKLTARFRGLENQAKATASAVEKDLKKSTDEARLALEVFRTSGERASLAIEKAAETWKDASAANRTFVEAYRAGDKAAIEHVARVRQQVDAEKELQEARAASKKSLKESAKEDEGTKDAENRFRDLKRAIEEYSASLTDANRPMADFESRAVKMAVELDDVIAKLPKAQRAAARVAKGTLLDQLAEAGEKLRQQKTTELVREVTSVIAQVGGDAATGIRLQYDVMIKGVEDAASALESLGTAEAKAAAARARESIPSIRTQRDRMIELEASARALAEAQQTVADFDQQANATYQGRAVTIEEYRQALATLAAQETMLRKRVQESALGTEERRRAEELLNQVLAERKALDATGITPTIGKSVDLTIELGRGLRDAAQAGLTLVQVLGKSNTELGEALAGAVSLGNGISSIGEAAKKAGSWSKLLSSGEGLLSMLPGVGQAVGGGMAIARSLGVTFGNDPETERLREAQKANTRALQDLTTKIGDLASSSFGANTVAAAGRVADYVFLNTLSDDGTDKVGNAADIAQRFGISYADLEAVAKTLGLTFDGTVDSFRALSAAIRNADFALLSETFDGLSRKVNLLSLIGGRAGDPIEQLSNQFAVLSKLAPALGTQFDAGLLNSADGRTQLRGQLSDILKRALTLDPNSAEAKALFESLGDLSPDQFLNLFESLITGIDGLGETAERVIPKLEVFRATAQLMGIEGVDYLTRLVGHLGEDFTELGGLLEGLDLSTQAGRDALQERLRDIVRMAEADGQVTESEQRVIDAVLNIFSVLGQLPDIIDPIAQALEAFDVQARTYGFSNAQRFQGLGALLSAKTPGLSDILGSSFQLDILTDSGRASLGDRLRAGIDAILADGKIDDAERPLLEALEKLLGLVLGAVDDAARDAAEAAQQQEADAQQAEQDRRDRISGRARGAAATVALEDLDGAEAFRASLAGYSEALSAFFGTFDVSSVAGIEKASADLSAFYQGLAAMSDAEILAQWGMTRDEVIDSILQVESGLDSLGQNLQQLAKEQGEFVTSIEVDFLNAIGRGMDAVLLQTELWVEGMIAQAKVLGVWTEELEAKIRTIGDAKIRSAEQQANPDGLSFTDRIIAAAAGAVGLVSSTGVASGQLMAAPSLTEAVSAPSARDEFVASDITRISTTEALRMTDYLAMIQTDSRGTRVAAEHIAAMMQSMVGGALPAVSVPAVSRTPASSGPLVIQVNGPVIGLDAEDVVEALAARLYPFISERMFQESLIASLGAGRPGLA